MRLLGMSLTTISGMHFHHVTYNHIRHALPFGVYTNLSFSDLVSIILYTKKEFSDNKDKRCYNNI